jgi:hypothetical protein
MIEPASKITAVAGHDAVDASHSLAALRDMPLDAVKGILVVLMVVYHAMNIFSTAGAEDYTHIRFVSGSFIFVSGYVVACFYYARFKADWWDTSKRLVLRGVKLLALFTLLNVLINLTGVGNPDKAQHGIRHYISVAYEVYISGVPGYASFQILLPIAYLLIASPLVLMSGRLSKWLLVASAAATLVPLVVDIESFNFEFLVIGMIGLSGGMLVGAIEKPFAMRGTWEIVGSLLVLVYLMKYLSVSLATCTLGTILIVKLLYDLSRVLSPGNYVARTLILLGQYSLVAYIAQIIFMQLLSKGLSRPRWDLGYEVVLVGITTVIALLLVSAGLGMLRERYWFVAKGYRLIFT